MQNTDEEKEINRMIMLLTAYFDTATTFESACNNNEVNKKKKNMFFVDCHPLS